ncbi:hypothetical protein [Prosthecobacter sp.]|uniref:hypothetical protein n=1 Tax=Prosthecobacter sp. TaxID=1965333 RepID=UPI003783B96A
MQFAAIVFLSVLAAVSYGVVHDQITARVCLEYFTIAHPRLILSTSPTVLGLFWGVVATWWVGVLLGVPLAIAARAGRRAKLPWRQFRRPILCLLAVMAGCAALAGFITWISSRCSDPVYLADLTGTKIPPHLRARFLAAAAAHLTSYGAGFIGSIILAIRTLWRRAHSVT